MLFFYFTTLLPVPDHYPELLPLLRVTSSGTRIGPRMFRIPKVYYQGPVCRTRSGPTNNCVFKTSGLGLDDLVFESPPPHQGIVHKDVRERTKMTTVSGLMT